MQKVVIKNGYLLFNGVLLSSSFYFGKLITYIIRCVNSVLGNIMVGLIMNKTAG